MITTFVQDELTTICIDGPRSHLDAKALQALLGRITGRGHVEGRVGQQNIRIVVANDGTEGAAHTPVD